MFATTFKKLITATCLVVGLAACGEAKDGPVKGEQCLSCHTNIELAHPQLPGQCTICHGGDADAKTKEDAHVAVPDNYLEVRGEGLSANAFGYIRNFSAEQLDQLDPAYIRFINPGDIRAADEACGDCHPAQTETVKNSIMTTNAGHYMPTRFLAGLQDRLAQYGSHPTVDPECDPELYPGSVCELTVLNKASEEAALEVLRTGTVEEIEDVAYTFYLKRRCDSCHAASFGKNDAPHLYRSTGCTSCHMPYGENGIYEGADEAMPRNSFPYPKLHEITTAIPTEQCATCHFQGGRIGLNYRGIREAGFGDDQLPPHAEAWSPGAYGRSDPNFYVIDEDTTNNIDETPPDLHHTAGMQCADCHVGSDVHGDGRLYTTAKQQLDTNCEDCHGTVRGPQQPDAAGQFRTTGRGRVLPQLFLNDDGKVAQKTVMGDTLLVPQVAELLASPDASAEMLAAMAPDQHDWSHTESLTCDTCHTSWNLNCLGCHVEVDFQYDQFDFQLGESTKGLVAGNRDTYDIDHFLLGVRTDGRIQTVNPSQQVQLIVRDENGELIRGGEVCVDGDPENCEELGEFRHRPNVPASIGFSPFFQHTTTKNARTCDDCHRVNDTPTELERIKGVYGYGIGGWDLPGPNGEIVDPMQMVDENGEPLTDWVHENSGPLPPERMDRALGVILDQLNEPTEESSP